MPERFTLLEKIGRGGMGVVWRARDEETGQVVALKLLHSAYAEDDDYIARFERELELASRIKSPNVVAVIGYGVREGTPYLALEYVDGPTLRQHLAEHGRYSWDEARALLIQIASGLAAAHAAGVIHRDIKPSNVLIGAGGEAKIADFGIARGLDLTRVTGTSTLLGTPAYLPPEGPQDARSDLYSLGILAYELLAGVPPFEGSTYAEVLMAHVRIAPDLDRLPVEARPIVGWLLEKDPKARPQSATELIEALEGKRAAVTPPAAVPERVDAAATALASEQEPASTPPVAAAAPVAAAVATTPPQHPLYPPAPYPQAPHGQVPRQSNSGRQLALVGLFALILVFAVAATAVLAAAYHPGTTAEATPSATQAFPGQGGVDQPTSTDWAGTSTPAPTDTPTASPTDTPTPSPTDTETPTPAPTPTPTDIPTPTPGQTPTPTPGPTPWGAVIQVPATVQAGSHVILVPPAGYFITVHASGTWCTGGVKSDGTASCGDAGGIRPAGSGEVAVLASAPIGALIGRFGSGPWFYVGSSATFAVGSSSDLELACNDVSGTYADNSGSVTVTITSTFIP